MILSQEIHCWRAFQDGSQGSERYGKENREKYQHYQMQKGPRHSLLIMIHFNLWNLDLVLNSLVIHWLYLRDHTYIISAESASICWNWVHAEAINNMLLLMYFVFQSSKSWAFFWQKASADQGPCFAKIFNKILR